MADFMVAGNRYRETFSTESEAKEWELLARAAIVAGKPLPPVSNGRSPSGAGLHTLGALFDHVERTHWRNNPQIKAPETAIRNAKFTVDLLGRNLPVSAIGLTEMRSVVAAVIDDGGTYATADRKLAALSKMLAVAVEEGVIPRKPRIPLSRQTQERIRFLSVVEARRMLALWQEWKQDELHAFTVVALHCGARLNALLSIKWRDFGPDYRTILFVGGDKKSLARTLPMSKVAIAAVKLMHERYPESDGPFAHFKNDGHLRTMWDRMRQHLGWPDVVIHTLRHTCATWMMQNTGNIQKVQRWLGHRRIEQTLMYAKLVPGDLEGMADVMDKAIGA